MFVWTTRGSKEKPQPSYTTPPHLLLASRPNLWQGLYQRRLCLCDLGPGSGGHSVSSFGFYISCHNTSTALSARGNMRASWPSSRRPPRPIGTTPGGPSQWPLCHSCWALGPTADPPQDPSSRKPDRQGSADPPQPLLLCLPCPLSSKDTGLCDH